MESIYYFVLGFSGILLAVITALLINSQKAAKIRSLETRLTAWGNLSYFINQIGDEAFNVLPVGIILYEKDTLTVKWNNPHALSIFLTDKLENKPLNSLHKSFEHLIFSSKTIETIEYDSKKYDCFNNKENQVLYLFDVTEREEIKKRYANQRPALGVLYLDNVEEALQNLDVYEKSNIRGEYLGIITDWINEHKGFLRMYTEDRMIFALQYQDLKKIIEDKFDVLNKIREISAKHKVRISASIGIACWDVDYEELNSLAQNAIELAEKRGGDQVVVNIQNEKIAYFGGKIDASEKSSRVAVRVKAQNFKELIEDAKNVLVMAHKQFDIDALGAMIGVLKMSLASKVACKIVGDIEQMDNTVRKIVVDLEKEEPKTFSQIIPTTEALKVMDENTLLVVVDTQSPNIVSSLPVLEKANKVAIIDHHRHGEDSFETVFSYVEPYASSSVELVAEMIEFYQKEIELSPIEASIMYGGILVDTNEFSYRTGIRTFGAIAYLVGKEASNAQVKEWLRISKETTLLINKLLSKVRPVIDGYGVVVEEAELIQDRVILAKVSEKILEIDGFNAGFTIAKVSPDKVGISARSIGQINVQLIMEEMGGGGHLNSAATQISNQSITSIYEQLKAIILRETDIEGEKMKIILLEDIESKGKKDDVLDVPNGYGNYLISNKKAILATPDALAKLEKEKKLEIEKEKQHQQLMKKLKTEIESKSVDIFINIGQDGKLFGSVTTKMIADAFKEQNGVEFDRKKLELTSEINSIGIYTATVTLTKDVKAQFEINVLEK